MIGEYFKQYALYQILVHELLRVPFNIALGIYVCEKY